MIIHSSTKDYGIEFEDSLSFVSKIDAVPNSYYVIDRNVWNLYKQSFDFIKEDSLYILDAVEDKKNIDTALDICKSIIEKGAKRNIVLVSVGGGITQDLTGFVANILYRGIGWIYIPTTLLAACDSCIGGKTSLNFESYKNLLGTFYAPDKIYICPEFFRTLSDNDIKSGLGEIVKFNVMKGPDDFSNLEEKLPSLLSLDPRTVNQFVKSSLAFKKSIIEEDEFDHGCRVLLNFAHTFGHAFEISSEYRIPHGSAVALGLVAVNALSCTRNMMNKALATRIENVVDSILPLYQPSEIKNDVVLSAIRKDKKQVGSNITAILLDSDYDLHIANNLDENDVFYCNSYVRGFLSNRIC